ncbi:hypothetical protein [Nocardia harenae]|uniref:hypothetical protein n=1 Tax=Nocardia harenae TaxID=358707 RepID=UPI00083692CC|nr:hypothetical protein [Nocardia harenae]
MAENTVDQTGSERYAINVGGNASGQFTVGHHNTVSRTDTSNSAEDTPTADLAALREEFARLREQLPTEGPLADQARENLDDLENAITAPLPNVSAMHSVRDWFTRKLPYLAAAVTGLIAHPVAEQLIAAGGAAVVAEFQRFFGSDLA